MIRAELEKLVTVRGTWVAAAGSLAFAIALALTALVPDNDLAMLPALASYPAFVAGLVCAHLLGDEYASGAIAVVYVAEPRRARVLAAKALAASVLGLAWGVLCGVAMALTAALWLAHFDVAWTWSGADAARFVAGAGAVTACFAVAGTAAAALVRRPGSASGVLGVVYLGLSGLLGSTTGLGVWHDYGIGAAQVAALEPGAHALGYPAALTVNVAYALAFLTLGVIVARRADV